MQLITITQKTDEALLFIQPLYESIFPVYERRDWQKLISMLDNGQMEVMLIKVEKTYVGFIICWKIGDWCYLEHLAIEPSLRGNQFGSRVIELLLKKSKGRLVLEVEHANDTESQRRILFYERLGIAVVPQHYKQPPYSKDGQPIPMHLMTGENNLDLELLKGLIENIRTTVYEQFY